VDELRTSYRHRIRRQIAASIVFVAALAGVIVAGGAVPEARPAIVLGGGGLAILGLLVFTIVNLRCPRCRRFLDSQFLLGESTCCPRCAAPLR
jgi:cytochrome c biogenesis protein CcdA